MTFRWQAPRARVPGAGEVPTTESQEKSTGLYLSGDEVTV
jgi:hypothetical protein